MVAQSLMRFVPTAQDSGGTPRFPAPDSQRSLKRIIGSSCGKETESPETGGLEPWWGARIQRPDGLAAAKRRATEHKSRERGDNSEQSGYAETGYRIFNGYGLTVKHPASNREAQRCVAQMHPLHRSPPRAMRSHHRGGTLLTSASYQAPNSWSIHQGAMVVARRS